MKRELCLGVVLSVLASMPLYAQQNFTYEQPYTSQTGSYTQPLKGSVVLVPSGASMPAVLTAQISTETATLGQSVQLMLNEDFYYNNNLVAPMGSIVQGNVIELRKAKRGNINGKICVRFNNITTPYGVQIPISAIIQTDDGTGVLHAGTKMDSVKEYTKDAVAGSAMGALSGLVFGAVSGGSVGKGAAIGTAIGAGGGLIKSGMDKGADVVIPANAKIQLLLTQPITTSSQNYNYEN